MIRARLRQNRIHDFQFEQAYWNAVTSGALAEDAVHFRIDVFDLEVRTSA
jgi:hypothetical protein